MRRLIMILGDFLLIVVQQRDLLQICESARI